MESTTPWLSVIICTYQGQDFIAKALESIECQHDEKIEVIVVDDGSTDKTLRIVNDFMNRLPLTLLAEKHTGNWVSNTNRGLREARGEYISLLHQDDVWQPERLATLRQLITAYPLCGMFIHPSYYIDESGRTAGHWTLPFSKKLEVVDSQTFLERLIVQNLLAIPAPLFKRTLALEAGTMREDLWFLADWEYWGRLGRLTQVAICHEFLASFRIHKASQTTTRSYDAADLRQQYHTVIETISDSCRNLPPSRRQRARKAALLNCEVSIMLAQLSHGHLKNIGKVLLAAARLSPAAWHRFWRDSRIIQRVAARLRVQLRKSRD